jgi:16S rRNA (guanine527-N7)-methyltransferase
MKSAEHPGLLRIFGEAQKIGALGSAPLSEIIDHATSFADAIPTGVTSCIDLGSGAGVPGLVIAVLRPEIQMTLIDRRAKRTDTLARSVYSLGVQDHVQVVCGDVEVLRYQDQYSHNFDAVCSRGFGPPAQTLRWAVDLVKSGGVVVVSEPPLGSPDRWAGINLQELGVSSPTRIGAVALFHVEHS